MAENEEQQKRRLKNPETFRERAIKAADAKASPKVKRSSKFKSPFKPVGAGYRKLKDVKQLGPVFKVLRFIGRIIVPKYFRTSYEELKKVTWPSFKQSRKLTYAVLVFAIVFGATIALVDWGLGKIFKHLLLK
ncbi:MAG TPA: preprotein translocase subunit SecE [Candidatus Saccharimonadales bacterium]